MLILIGGFALNGCSETAFMNAEERAEYNRVQQAQAEERRRQYEEQKRKQKERIRQATGGKCETESCYSEYKLRLSFETTCENYGHRQNTAAFNQCVGMEINNYERDQQLERMERQVASRAAEAREEARKARKQRRWQTMQNSTSTVTQPQKQRCSPYLPLCM